MVSLVFLCRHHGIKYHLQEGNLIVIFWRSQLHFVTIALVVLQVSECQGKVRTYFISTKRSKQDIVGTDGRPGGRPRGRMTLAGIVFGLVQARHKEKIRGANGSFGISPRTLDCWGLHKDGDRSSNIAPKGLQAGSDHTWVSNKLSFLPKWQLSGKPPVGFITSWWKSLERRLLNLTYLSYWPPLTWHKHVESPVFFCFLNAILYN